MGEVAPQQSETVRDVVRDGEHAAAAVYHEA